MLVYDWRMLARGAPGESEASRIAPRRRREPSCGLRALEAAADALYDEGRTIDEATGEPIPLARQDVVRLWKRES